MSSIHPDKDDVKYMEGSDTFVAVRCPVCNLKRMVKNDEDAGCEAGCKNQDSNDPKEDRR